jgi:hypothetical protein
MNWRPLAALQGTETLYVYPQAPDHAELPDDYGRSGELLEALARLEAATRLRDGAAVARILGNLSTSEDGQWLLRQCVAAGLREVATVIADGNGQTTSAGAA